MVTDKVVYGFAICAWLCGAWKRGAQQRSSRGLDGQRREDGTSWRCGLKRSSGKERRPMTPTGEPLRNQQPLDLLDNWDPLDNRDPLDNLNP